MNRSYSSNSWSDWNKLSSFLLLPQSRMTFKLYKISDGVSSPTPLLNFHKSPEILIQRFTDLSISPCDSSRTDGSAYLLTCCSFQPLYGRAFQFFPQKWCFTTAFVTFEIGTLICAVAQNSATFIAGRAMQGLGYAGLFIGSESDELISIHLGDR